jgi:AraC-like DNA-binding protein
MVNILICLIIFHLIFFSAFLVTRKDSRKRSHSLLALFFFSLAINIFNKLCFNSEYIFLNFTHAFFIGAPFAFLYAPAFYIYVRSLTEINFKFQRKDFIHFIPFISFTVYLLITFYFRSAVEKQYFIKHESTTMTLWNLLTPVLQTQIMIYAIFIIRTIVIFRKRIKGVFSTIDNINYSWLKFIVIGVAFLWLADLPRYFASIRKLSQITLIETLFYAGFLLLSYLILFKALTQPEIFSLMPEFPQKKKKSLSDTVTDQYLSELLSFMVQEKPYLDPSITIFTLSEKTSIPQRSLSDVINNSLNQNFYDFINSYRVKESQRLLLENKKESKTILEILYQSGFGTKSSFNQAFKKHTGKTPTQFKKQILADFQ